MKPNERLGIYLCSIAGLIILAIGMYLYNTAKNLTENGIEVQGVVVALRTKGSSFSPVVEFIDHQGIKRLHYSAVSSDPPRFYVGEKVKILYNPEDPKYPVNAKINSTITVWGAPILLICMGSFFVLLSWIVWYLIKYRRGVILFKEDIFKRKEVRLRNDIMHKKK